MSAVAKALTLAQLERQIFPKRRPILERSMSAVFREGHLGQVYAERGVGKTWFLQMLALVAASGGASALGFSAAEPSKVAYIDGEMGSDEIQERFDRQCKMLSVSPEAPITVVAADWQDDFLRRLDTPAGQAFIEPYIAAANLVILDNRSCLFDPEGEKDPVAWQPAQDWLLSLRRRGKAVLLGHHSNRLGGARGHSKAEDPMNLLIKLTRPEGYTQDEGARFAVTFEKSRGVYGPDVAPFVAHLTERGWLVESAAAEAEAGAAGKLLEYVRLASGAGETIKSATAAISGAKVNRNAGFKAWKYLQDEGRIQKDSEGHFVAA